MSRQPLLIEFGALCLAIGRAEGGATALSANGREGGRRGGKARAAALSPERRKAIASAAAKARWAGYHGSEIHQRESARATAENTALKR